MGRIRTTKPEFHSHEDLSALPAETHLLASALLNYADDEGYFNAHPVLVKAGTNPLRDDGTPMDEMLHQLAKIGYIEIAKRGDKCFGRIINFKIHQRVAHPTPSKLRAKFEELPLVSGGNRELFSPEQGTGNREQGTGEQGVRAPAAASPVSGPMPGTPSANPDVSTLVQRIVMAHPRSLARKTRFGEATHAQASAIVRAMEDEVAAAGCSPIAALEMILTQVEMHAREVPATEHPFIKDIDRGYMSLHEYRKDSADFIREAKPNGSNKGQARTNANIAAADQARQIRESRQHPA